ncbi:transglutaminase [Actinokineospora bangkokensis]|uniref:Transglutaminase n=2 Tax=Actinokineospora bangkokensis TaxID=1193682 RepID=A0A1Q9LHF5_9PSEU|nr:transglutaminase [Actinokineospora bangkokensis]
MRLSRPGPVTVSVAPAGAVDDERLWVEGAPGSVREVGMPGGTRLHVVAANPGELALRYRARHPYAEGASVPVTEAERIEYLRPSRYCPADRLGGYATRVIGDRVDPEEKVRVIVDHVAGHLSYVGGSSGPTDDAVDTLLLAEGVCRDYAHLAVALCRAVDVPARFVSVYAPGLSPMDFHAVFEAAIGDRWYVFDATRLAPRPSFVRIATGRDAADTAFLTTPNDTELITSTVTVTSHPHLPEDDGDQLVALT